MSLCSNSKLPDLAKERGKAKPAGSEYFLDYVSLSISVIRSHVLQAFLNYSRNTYIRRMHKVDELYINLLRKFSLYFYVLSMLSLSDRSLTVRLVSYWLDHILFK